MNFELSDLTSGTETIPPERVASIEGEFVDVVDVFKDQGSAEEAGSFMTGVILGARLFERDHTAARVVIACIERDMAIMTDDEPAERMEVRVRTIVDALVAA